MSLYTSHRARLWLYILVAATLIFLIAPSVLVVPMSFNRSTLMVFPPKEFSLRWYANFFSSAVWIDAAIVSVKISFITALLATPIGTAAAYAMQSGKVGSRKVIEGILLLPMVVPLILIGIGIFFVYARLNLVNTIAGLVVADTLLAVPFVYISVTAGLKSYDMAQENAARSLGASRLMAFLTVTLPQIRLSILSGAFLAFSTAFDEVVVALFISGGKSATLTKVMFASLRDEVDPTIAAVSSMLLAVTIVPMLLLHLASMRQTKRGGD